MNAIDVYAAVTEDKATWGDGPWQAEPDHKEWRDAATGLHCIAHRNMSGGNWCGYVAVPPGHPAHRKDYGDVDVEVHGGLTYGAECQGAVCHVPPPGEPDDVWWLGFDCAHCWDVRPASDKRDELRGWQRLSGADSRYCDLAYVERECTNLAKQLADLR